MDLHVGDTVTFTNTVENIADGIDGEDGRVAEVDRLWGVLVQLSDDEVQVSDLADITLSDCPHQGEDE